MFLSKKGLFLDDAWIGVKLIIAIIFFGFIFSFVIGSLLGVNILGYMANGFTMITTGKAYISNNTTAFQGWN